MTIGELMTQNVTEVKRYSIPEDELERLLLNCATLNNCIDAANNVKNSCECYQKYSEQSALGKINEIK